MDAGSAETWFVAGTVPLIAGGGLHVIATLLDTVRPTFFTPVDPAVRAATDATGIRLVPMFDGSPAKPSMWSVWLGVHIGLGLGLVAFGLVCLLIAAHDFALIGRVDALRPLTVAIPAAYLAIALRFWFYGPVLITGSATGCFTVAAVMAA